MKRESARQRRRPRDARRWTTMGVQPASHAALAMAIFSKTQQSPPSTSSLFDYIVASVEDGVYCGPPNAVVAKTEILVKYMEGIAWLLDREFSGHLPAWHRQRCPIFPPPHLRSCDRPTASLLVAGRFSTCLVLAVAYFHKFCRCTKRIDQMSDKHIERVAVVSFMLAAKWETVVLPPLEELLFCIGKHRFRYFAAPRGRSPMLSVDKLKQVEFEVLAGMSWEVRIAAHACRPGHERAAKRAESHARARATLALAAPKNACRQRTVACA